MDLRTQKWTTIHSIANWMYYIATYIQYAFPVVVSEKHGHTPATTKPQNNLAVVNINAVDPLINLAEAVNEVMEQDADIDPEIVNKDVDVDTEMVEPAGGT